MSDHISSDIRVLSNAYSTHIRTFTRYWTFAATVTVLAVTAEPSDGIVKLFGIELTEEKFFPVCAAFCAALNFMYCVCHLQAYRSGDIFRSYLNKINASEIKIAGTYTLLDAAHQLYPSAINRIYPVVYFLPGAFPKKYVKLLKLPIDLFVFLTPIVRGAYSCAQVGLAGIGPLLWLLLLPSGIMTAVLVVAGVKWLWNPE